MKIFFDTNVFYTDLLFKNQAINLLFEMSRENLIELYISKMVLLELEKAYVESVQKKLNNLKELEKLNIKINDAIDNDDYLYNYNSDRIKNIFHSRIEELKKEYKVNIIEVDNYEINQLLYRYIEKKAPFDNNKNSWQDCLVWSSYEKIINKTDDKYYIFIVNDKKAFSSESNRENLHHDYLIDGKNIEYYDKIINFSNNNLGFKNLKKELEKLKLTKQFKQLELLDKLKDSIKEMNIIDKNFIENNFADGIVSEIKEIDFLELEKEKIYKKFGDLVEIVTPTDNIECDNIEYDIKIENNILLVYGNIIIINETDIYTINYLRESSDDWYIDNEVWVKLSMDFSFNINVNEDEINIENFELSKENISDFKLSNIQVVDIIK